jgi:ABC-type uncharacterized transport system substrate-binding protein
MVDMRRREFITLLGSAAAAWPLAARAQQPAMPVIGWLNGAGPPQPDRVEAVRRGLSELGYVEGRNVAIELRWADGDYDRMLEMAAELARQPLAVMIVTGGGAPAVITRKIVTATPVVFATGADPVKAGLVASLNRPGGNATGVYFFTAAIEAKRIGMLHDLVPGAGTIGILLNPTYPDAAAQSLEIEGAAHSLGLRTLINRASTEAEIDAAFASLATSRVGALLIAADPFFNSRRQQIVAHSARQEIPAIYNAREYAAAGGLMSYGTSIVDAYRQIGVYAGRILKGERAGDLPVVQPTKFEFVINL